jgi:hypothetical protein
VAGIGWAQEFQRVATCTTTPARNGGAPHFGWDRADRRVTCYYFYVWDDDFGPAFVKIGSYFPYPIKVWLNGHEWAKRQATQAGISFTALSNGFASTEDPEGLQAICDRLGPSAIAVFFQRWLARLPTPLTAADRAAGYWWELSMRQVEVSRTLVFDDPRRARAFFESLVTDNVGVGRPQQVSMVFARQLRRPTKHPYQERIFSPGTEVSIDFHLQAQPRQAVPEGREGPADRDRDQQASGHRRAGPARAPARAGGRPLRNNGTKSHAKPGAALAR